MQGGDTSAVLAAGMPNIYGYWQTRYMSSNSAGDLSPVYVDGNLFDIEEKTGTYLKIGYDMSTSQNAGLRQINFNASRVNSIFGKSTTVQPPALVLIPQIKY